MENLSYKDKSFYLGDKPFRILSGAIHYFRIHPNYWMDRLLKLKACGLNTVETYVPWNLHEENEGEYNFEEFCDIVKFIELANELGLKVIVRPGPYICAEWDFGGLPSWLVKDKNMKIRCNYKPYTDKVDKWYSVLLPKLVPYLSTNGGPIIAMQVENEYGSYGDDKEYLTHIENLMISLGINVLLFTSDGREEYLLHSGTLPHILKTLNFGSNPKEAFPNLDKFQTGTPYMCCEFWDGWFDHWGTPHHTREPDEIANTLDEMVSMGASFNMYMFIGGTNFGFFNGANQVGEKYQPTVSSYDYCALLTEAGDLTEQYHKCKAVLEKHFGKAPEIEVHDIKKQAYGEIKLTKKANLFNIVDSISKPIHSAPTLSMEEIGQNFGYTLYSTTIKRPVNNEAVFIMGLCDRAHVYLDKKYMGTVYRNDDINERYVLITVPEGTTAKLDILVENMGRVNYGHVLGEHKGITHGVRIGNDLAFGWDIYPIDMNTLPDEYAEIDHLGKEPAFYQGTFNVDEPNDTFLDMQNFTKGVVMINGFNLGRYWKIGPTGTLYIPAPLLNVGENTITVFESDEVINPVILSIDTPKL